VPEVERFCLAPTEVAYAAPHWATVVASFPLKRSTELTQSALRIQLLRFRLAKLDSFGVYFGQVIEDNRDTRNLLSSFLLFWLWTRCPRYYCCRSEHSFLLSPDDLHLQVATRDCWSLIYRDPHRCWRDLTLYLEHHHWKASRRA
jgi:hypothetical protein